MRLAFIGDGGVSRAAREALSGEIARGRFEVAAVLVRDPARAAEPPAVASFEAMMAARPDVVVECAGHEALRRYGEAVLSAGATLVAVSAGALAEDAFRARIEAAAAKGGGRLVLPSGAIGGLDALAAARIGGLTRVTYRGRKPPAAWKGSPAGDRLDLDALDAPTTFFTGDARQAALDFPKNSNVAASVALAGAGFDRTTVELIADPTVTKNVHELSFAGPDGVFTFTIQGEPSPANPKTSLLTAHSVAQALLDLRADADSRG